MLHLKLTPNVIIGICLAISMSIVLATKAGIYNEVDGLVVIEMESTESPLKDDEAEWLLKTDQRGWDTSSTYTGDGYLEFNGNDWSNGDAKTPLEYKFKINKAGAYEFNVHSAKVTVGDRTDVANDFYVRVEGDYNAADGGAPLSVLKEDTKWYGGGTSELKWCWEDKLQLESGGRKYYSYYEFKAGETYTLVVSGRSRGFKVNRFFYRHMATVTKTEAHDLSNPESPLVDEGPGDEDVTIGGDLMQWHRVDLKLAAIESSESANPNPFMDYRLNVTFTAPSGKKYMVPGYFATDGKGGNSGNIWMAHLNPSERGTWNYRISFRSGSDVAVNLAPTAGSAVSPYDGKTGTFSISASNKSGDDFRAYDKGMLVNRGHHYLTYGGSGKSFIYTGAGLPENILGYRGFTNTDDTVHEDFIGHDFDVHGDDWNNGDPDWGNEDGKRLIGALNYIAEKGANAIYMMSNTIGGDAFDCFPHLDAENSRDRYDLLKLIQWDIALAHAQAKGIFLHWHLAENEEPNYTYYGGSATSGSLTPERKLYFRMLTAVFGHYNGLKWNLCEEIEWDAGERTAQMAYLKEIDPYDHPVTYQVGGAGLPYDTYNSHLGDPNIDSGSFQGSNSTTNMFDEIVEWREASAQAGTPWTCAWDEPQEIRTTMDPEVSSKNYPVARREKMWPCLMGGGDGFLWYVRSIGGSGYGFDQRLEDFSVMEVPFNWCGYVRDFLENLPLATMTPTRNIVDSATGQDYALVKAGEYYAIYNDQSGTGMRLDLTGQTGTFIVKWFDPRNGGPLQNGSVTSVEGGSEVSLGNAPNNTGEDWAVLVSKEGSTGTDPTVRITSPADGQSYVVGQSVVVIVEGSDDSGIDRIRLKVDNANIDPLHRESPSVWDLGALAVGSYEISALLFAKDGGSVLSAPITINITGAGGNNAPVIESPITATKTVVTVGETTTLNVVAGDQDGDTLTYTWSKISGSGTVNFSPNETNSSSETVAGFSAADIYELEVTVSDGNGGVDSKSIEIIVNESSGGREPTVSFDLADDDIFTSDQTFTVTVTGSDDSGIASMSLSVDGNWQLPKVIDAPPYQWDVGPLPEGSHVILGWLKATDGDTKGVTANITVIPAVEGNRAPSISSIASSPSALVLPANTVELTATATDPDGDDLTYSWSGTGVTFVAPNDDTTEATLPSTVGTYVIQLKVSDGKGGRDTSSIEIVISDTPTAGGGSGNGGEDDDGGCGCAATQSPNGTVWIIALIVSVLALRYRSIGYRQ